MPGVHTILIVDDEPNLRRTLAAVLQRAGYRVTLAGSAREADQRLQAGAYDLMFLDIKMPDMDGMIYLPRIRQKYPWMPVLILTGNATLKTAIEAVRHGARDYLLKPVEPAQILTRVKEVIAEQQEPARRQAIVTQIQGLLSELSQLDHPALQDESGGSRAAPDPARYLRCGPFTVDLHTRHVLMGLTPSDSKWEGAGARDVALPPSTFDFFVTLVRHSPVPVGYETLLLESQGYSLTRIEAREMARWQVHELRKALEEDPRHPRYIITVRDVGYRLVP